MSPFTPDYGVHTIVPDALYPKIGRISARFSHLDIEMNRAIWALIGKNRRVGRAITADMQQFSLRADLLLRLGMLKRPKGTHARLKEIVGNLKATASDRNRLIHDEPFMGSTTEPLYVVQKGDPKGPDYKTYHFGKAVLDDLAKRLADLRVTLFWFSKRDSRWLNEPLPSLDKSPTRLQELSRQMPRNPDKHKRPRLSSRQRREQAAAKRAAARPS